MAFKFQNLLKVTIQKHEQNVVAHQYKRVVSDTITSDLIAIKLLRRTSPCLPAAQEVYS